MCLWPLTLIIKCGFIIYGRVHAVRLRRGFIVFAICFCPPCGGVGGIQNRGRRADEKHNKHKQIKKQKQQTTNNEFCLMCAPSSGGPPQQKENAFNCSVPFHWRSEQNVVPPLGGPKKSGPSQPWSDNFNFLNFRSLPTVVRRVQLLEILVPSTGGPKISVFENSGPSHRWSLLREG